MSDDFPWKRSDRDAYAWDRRMPWQRDDDAGSDDAEGEPGASTERAPAPSPPAEDAPAPSPAPPAEHSPADPEAPGDEGTAPERVEPRGEAPPPAPLPAAEREEPEDQGPVAPPEPETAPSPAPADAAMPGPPPVGAAASPERARQKAPAIPPVPPPAPSPATTGSSGAGRIALGVVAAVIGIPVLLISAGAIFSSGGSSRNDPDPEEVASAETAATETVLRFFDAVAEGERDEALSYLSLDESGTGEDHALLDEAVFEAAHERAPLEGFPDVSVELDPDYSSHAVADVAMALGGETHEAQLDLWRSGGDWLISPSSLSIRYGEQLAALDLTIEGVPLEPDLWYPMLPGLYALDTASDLIEPAWFSEDGEQHRLSGDRLAIPNPARVFHEAALSDEGLDIVADAVDRSLDACLASRDLDASCAPVDADWFGGLEPIDGTVTRTVRGEQDDDGTEPDPTYDDPLVVRATRGVHLTVSARCLDGAEEVDCEAFVFAAQPAVDLRDLETPAVTWRQY
ncbi:hypothetical protein [Microbacterium sp. gxy059]|uniref:hypothetical protein n=1 Tax=Microbacterium sp. gxy059 TaxID=2957199 RepID=UPI003D955DE2